MKKIIIFTKNLIFNMVAALCIVVLVKTTLLHLAPSEVHLNHYSFETTRSQISSSEGVWFLSESVIRRK